MIPKKNLLSRLKKSPHIRIAYTAMIASILLVASLAVMNPLNAAATDDKRTCHATGTFTSGVVPDIATQTVGDLIIRTRVSANTYTGGFEGRTITLRATTSDTTAKMVYDSGLTTVIGSLCGSPQGKLTGIFTFTQDQTACPCPPGIQTLEGIFIVQDGSGQGGFEGVCGGGTFKAATGQPATYDWTLHFGKSCRSNDG